MVLNAQIAIIITYKMSEAMEFRNAKSHELNECHKRQYTCPHCNEVSVYDERTILHT